MGGTHTGAGEEREEEGVAEMKCLWTDQNSDFPVPLCHWEWWGLGKEVGES